MYGAKSSCETRFFLLCKLAARHTNPVVCVTLAYTKATIVNKCL